MTSSKIWKNVKETDTIDGRIYDPISDIHEMPPSYIIIVPRQTLPTVGGYRIWRMAKETIAKTLFSKFCSSYHTALTLTEHPFLVLKKKFNNAVLWNGVPRCNSLRMQWFCNLLIWIISQPVAFVLFVYTLIQFEVCLVTEKGKFRNFQ